MSLPLWWERPGSNVLRAGAHLVAARFDLGCGPTSWKQCSVHFELTAQWPYFLETVQCTFLQCCSLLENSVVLLLGKSVVVTECGILEMALIADPCSVDSSTLCDDRSWQLSSSCQNLYRFWKCSDVTPCYCNISCQICSSVSSIIESN